MPFPTFTREFNYSEVNTFGDLPVAIEHTGEVYIITTATGTWPLNRKRAGLYRSDGINWVRLGVVPTAEEMGAIKSIPPDGYEPVTNLYRDPETGKLWVDYDDGE